MLCFKIRFHFSMFWFVMNPAWWFTFQRLGFREMERKRPPLRPGFASQSPTDGVVVATASLVALIKQGYQTGKRMDVKSFVAACSRFAGKMKLVNRGLRDIPYQVFQYTPGPDEKWWQTVDLTELDVSGRLYWRCLYLAENRLR